MKRGVSTDSYRVSALRGVISLLMVFLSHDLGLAMYDFLSKSCTVSFVLGAWSPELFGVCLFW